MEDIWTQYNSRLTGASRQHASAIHTVRRLNRMLPNTLSYRDAIVDGVNKKVAIISSDNMTEKTIITEHGDTLLGGELVQFVDNYWIVTSVDADQKLYAKGTMEQCNYNMKWIDSDGKIHECMCIVSDGTKYLTGETESSYNENGMVAGDTRIGVILPFNSETVKLGRQQRIMIDAQDTGEPLVYRITKPFKVGNVYNGHGAMSFVMREVMYEPEHDNFDLMIADYYKYFLKDSAPNTEGIIPGSLKPGDPDHTKGKKVLI